VGQSISDILQKAINKALDEGVDLSDSQKRKEFELKYRKDHPNFKCHRTTFNKAFQKVFKSRGMDLTQHKITRKKKYNVKLAKQIHEQNASKVEQETPEPQQILPQTDYEVVAEAIKDDVWTKESACAYWRCITTPMTMGNPELQLSDNEISDLANMWIGGLNRYASEKARLFTLLAFGTISVLGPHVYKGYKLHKQAQINKNNHN